MPRIQIGTETRETTVCEVFAVQDGDFVVVARFYAYKHNRKWRQEYAEKLAAIFIDQLRRINAPSYRLGQRLKAATIALHKGFVRWNDARTWGWRWAALGALLTDGLLEPGVYLEKGE